MAGWHTRFWRRVKVAPGLTINLSKSGPSLSVGPRGSKVTFGRRGIRQTVGLPGTGLYMSRQLTNKPPAVYANEPEPPTAPDPIPNVLQAAPAAEPATAEPYELHYGMPLAAAVVIGVVVAAYSQPAGVVVAAAILAFITGLLYEALAAHHPFAAKLIAQVVVAIAAVVTILLGVILVVGLAGVGASSKTRRRS